MDQEPVEMVAGDKLRQPTRFNTFKVENRSTQHTVYLMVVVGRGDYDSQIIRGEVAVNPRLRTASGELREDSRYWLSLYLRSEPNFSPYTLEYGEVVHTYPTREVIDADVNNRGLKWDGARWVVLTSTNSGAHWLEFDAGWNFQAKEPAPSDYDTRLQSNFDFDGNAHVFAILHTSSSLEDALYRARRYGDANGDFNLEVLDQSGRWSMDQDAIINTGTKVFWSSEGNNNTENGLYMIDTAMLRGGVDFKDWTLVQSAYEIKMDWGTGALPTGAALVDRPDLDEVHLLIDYYYTRYDRQTGKKKSVNTNGGGGRTVFRKPTAYGDGAVHTLEVDKSPTNAQRLTLKKLWSEPGYSEVTMRATAVPSACASGLTMPDSYTLTLADLKHEHQVSGQTVIRGEVIRAVLAFAAGSYAAVPDDYLDHVYGIRIGAGDEPGGEAIRSSATFAAADVDDDFEATLPGHVRVQVDAELFGG
jgi:hypothetical protein